MKQKEEDTLMLASIRAALRDYNGERCSLISEGKQRSKRTITRENGNCGA